MAEQQIFIAKTMYGLEPVLAEELRQIGAKNIQEIKRAVVFEGDTRILYKANYCLRSALRILVPVHSFEATNEKDFYAGIRKVDWSQYLNPTDTIAVDSFTQGETFRHSQFVALLTKDAVVDQFRDKYSRRPNVDVIAPHLRINVHVQGDKIDVSLDASGDSLHRRSYRTATMEAPLNEVLAAGMVLLSGWNAESDFVDPMCGSGTIPIEAAWLATRTPPQIKRAGFGFFKWPNFDETLWNDVKQAADAQIRPCPVKIYASDIDQRARNATAINLMGSGMENNIRLQSVAFDKLLRPSNHGVLITNPPYDERMRVDEISTFYKAIGDRFKKQWMGWDAWLISSNRAALKQVGLRTSRRLALFNGALECSFHKYEMYEGTKNTDPNPGFISE